MRAIHFYIILFLVGLGFSCKKKNYPVSAAENEVVFYFKGDVNSNPVSFAAGNDDYYMYSAYGQDVNGVYNFLGDLRKVNCSSCPALRIKINDFRVSSSGAGAVIDSSLQKGFYPFIAGDKSPYSVEFASSYNRPAAGFQWDFGDGNTSTQANPTHTYAKSGTYNVCLSVTGANSCVSTICNEQKIGPLSNSARTFITAANLGVKTIQFSQIPVGFTPVSYLWDFGDGTPRSSLSAPSHSYTNHGAYPVTLQVTDANNKVITARYNVVTMNDASSCATNYSVASVSTVTNSPAYLNLKGVEISWVDASGTVYTSNSSLQPSSNYFEILSVENYENNENQQKTKKIHVRFRATVYYGTQSMLIDNAEAVFAVAYQ
ncbi:MAG: PKD domain-containing protein [Bacteroidota bacterium]